MFAARLRASLSLLLLAACGDPGGGADSCLLRAADDCDVREADCQEHVHAVLACVREAEHPMPQIDVLTPEEFAAKYPPPEPPTAEEQRWTEQLVAAYRLLRFLPYSWTPADDTFELSPPIINYDLERREVNIVADGADREGELYLLLYALALADRDAESDLLGLRLTQAGTLDSERALITLYAGEATFYADLASARETDLAALAERFYYEEALDDARAALGDHLTPWGQAMGLFQYYFGANYLLGRYREGGPAAITAAYDDAIASTAHALGHGLADIDGEFAGVDAPLPAPPAGFRYVLQDSFGAAMYYLYRARQTGQVGLLEAEVQLAGIWNGDRLVIAADDASDEVAAVWQIAGVDGDIRETIVVGTTPNTQMMFEDLFL